MPALLVPLMVVHSTPMFTSFPQGSATSGTSSTVRHIQIGIGVVALLIAALITVRYLVRPRAPVATPGGNASTLLLDSNTPIAIRRLVDRAHNAWENGSLWVAWVIGLGSVSIDGVPFVAAIIVASGAAIGTQVSAAVAFLVGMYAVVEIILVTYLASPEKTQGSCDVSVGGNQAGFGPSTWGSVVMEGVWAAPATGAPSHVKGASRRFAMAFRPP